MRKVIASINVTIDGFCDHTAVIADDELHKHFNHLMRAADTVFFGRKTYQLMEESWPPLVAKPSGNKPTDEFARLIDDVEKVVFTHTLTEFNWKHSRIARHPFFEELQEVKDQPGATILIGSPSLIAESFRTDLVDEYQFCVQPIVLGKGLLLFKNNDLRKDLKLLDTKVFNSGVVLHRYERKKVK